ncbi:MAG: fused MFS/spermidine synthase [Planctomycetota bacterium]
MKRTHAAGGADAPAPGNSLIALFYLLSFCSGVAALIYEVTWARMLALSLGSTTLSTGSVVAGFMGGMGLGAYLYHRVQDRGFRPVLAYGLLEIGIALTTATLTLGLYALPRGFAWISATIGPGLGVTLISLSIVVCLVALPSILMGATFPALCSVMIRSVKGVNRHLGLIYGINTIGAAGGALLSGLILVERLGLRSTVLVANVLNITVGVVALLLLRTALGHAGVPDRREETGIPTRLPHWVTGCVLLGSGFSTLAYEIIWFRAMRYLFGHSTYALTTVLVIFLAGLGLGALLLPRVLRRKSPESDLATCQFAIAVLGLLAAAAGMYLANDPEMRAMTSIFSPSVLVRPWWQRLLINAGISTVALLPAALCMGLSFPLASRLFLGDVTRLGRRIGGAYLLANIGSIFGSLLAAVLLLPLLGTIGGTKAVALINLLLGLLVLFWIRKETGRVLIRAGVACLLVLTLAMFLPASITLSGEKIGKTHGVLEFVEEGDLATVQVHSEPEDATRKVMSIDGCLIGWSGGYLGTPLYEKQIVLAHLPMVLDTRIRTTLNVGLGCGSTLEAVAAHQGVETLDCVEISGAVVRGAELFEESRVLEDPRVNLFVDDAVRYLLQTDARYDLIISDGKQHPFFAGNASLLCREFYEFCRDRLTDIGMFAQWTPTAMLATDLRISLRTLCQVFPCVELFFYPSQCVVVIASLKPLAGRPGMDDEQFAAGRAGADMAAYTVTSIESMRSFHVADRQQILTVLGSGPVSTWDHMLLDFSSYKSSARERGLSPVENMRLMLSAEQAAPAGPETFDQVNPVHARSASLIRQAFLMLESRQVGEARLLAEQALQVNPQDTVTQGVAEYMRYEESRRARKQGEGGK